MYVLIKKDSESNIESVVGIGDDNVEDAIRTGDDLIREELEKVNCIDDVDFEEHTGVASSENLIGMWAISDASWEMWKI